MSRKPLSGIRVLDLTRVLAGPYCTMILADLGADVIKIEMPGRGDDSRQIGPFLGGESVYFMSLNRGKKSVVLNLKNPGDRGAFLELSRRSDVLVENFRPGTMETLGLGYDELRHVNPRMVYASCSGFGQTGPYSEKPCYDQIAQGMGGIMSITGEPQGPPTRVGASIADITAGLFTAIGIFAALRHRDLTGEGQRVDVAMLDCQVAILENAIARYFAEGKSPGRLGNRHPSLTPFASFETSDGYINVAAGNDHLWRKFCQAIEMGQLAEDPRFSSNPLRTRNWPVLEPILIKAFKTKGTSEWLRILEGAGIPCGPINRIEDVVNDEQVRSRDMLVGIHHPGIGEVIMAGMPIKLSLTPCSVERPAPRLGEHTVEILDSLAHCDSDPRDMLG